MIRKAVKTAKAARVTEITFDQWAESGGTGGIFGSAWQNGTLRIVDEDGTVVRKAKGDK